MIFTLGPYRFYLVWAWPYHSCTTDSLKHQNFPQTTPIVRTKFKSLAQTMDGPRPKKHKTMNLWAHAYKLWVGGVSPRCGIEQIRAGGIGLLGLFPKWTIPSKGEVRPSTKHFYGFFLNSLLTILWVIRVYIVWVKGIRVTLSFAGHSWLRHFQHVLLMWLSQVAPLASHVTRSTSWAIFTNLILNSLQMNPTKYKEIN